MTNENLSSSEAECTLLHPEIIGDSIFLAIHCRSAGCVNVTIGVEERLDGVWREFIADASNPDVKEVRAFRICGDTLQGAFSRQRIAKYLAPDSSSTECRFVVSYGDDIRTATTSRSQPFLLKKN